ncbi:hypothetical protein HU200_026578 [Digitaria exilis]|uniref:Wall-associated receptor kinase C-terminal domain-containing protein n=1 Tax=Digitaria exilis TaxID=1010633 RepID=A0A835BW83_9POAL|nr:hypothetical protein HU200_026578 [Digitaria exilis]
MCQKPLPCGGHVDVHYPFFLVYRPYCGYPGMAVVCDGACAIMKLSGHNYTILDISYDDHTVTLADREVLNGGECPRVTHNVTVSPSSSLSFTANNDNISFFFDCVFTAGTTPARPTSISPINCSSSFLQAERDSSRVSYVAAQADVASQEEWPRACRTAVVVPVLKDWVQNPEYQQNLNSDGYGEVLKRGFELSWETSEGPCNVCEQTKGKCSHNHSGEFVGCLCPDGRVRTADCGKPGLWYTHLFFLIYFLMISFESSTPSPVFIVFS